MKLQCDEVWSKLEHRTSSAKLDHLHVRLLVRCLFLDAFYTTSERFPNNLRSGLMGFQSVSVQFLIGFERFRVGL